MIDLNTKVSDMPLETRTKNILAAEGVDTVAELVEIPAWKLLTYPDLGRGRLASIEKALASHGLHLPSSVNSQAEQDPPEQRDPWADLEKGVWGRSIQIVRRLCEGGTMREVEDELGLKRGAVRRVLDSLRLGHCFLPYDFRTFKAREADILANLVAWHAYEAEKQARWDAYVSGVVRFGF